MGRVMLRGFESLSCHSTKAPSGGRGLRRSGNWAGEGSSAAQDLGAGLRALFRADDAALMQVVELAQARLEPPSLLRRSMLLWCPAATARVNL